MKELLRLIDGDRKNSTWLAKWSEKAYALQLLIVMQLSPGLIVLFRSVAPQRPSTGDLCTETARGVDTTILYPTLQMEAQKARLVLQDPVYGAIRGHVVLRLVNLLHLKQIITGGRNSKNERVAFAQWLVSGKA